MSVVNRKMAKEYFENGRRDFSLHTGIIGENSHECIYDANGNEIKIEDFTHNGLVDFEALGKVVNDTISYRLNSDSVPESEKEQLRNLIHEFDLIDMVY